MIYFLALIPATALTIAGYFVLYLSARSEGGMRSFGRYLGFWAFTLAGLVILGAIFASAHHGHRAMFGGSMRGGMHGAWPGAPPFYRPCVPEEMERQGEAPLRPPGLQAPPGTSPSEGSATPTAPSKSQH